MATEDEENPDQKGQLNKKVVTVSSGEKVAEKNQDDDCVFPLCQMVIFHLS